MGGFSFISIALLILAMVLVVRGLRIVKQSEAMVIERLGRYRTTLTAGINIILPFIARPRPSVWRYVKEDAMGERIAAFKMLERIDLRETVFDFPRQSVITRDNVVTEINGLIYFQIVDPVKSVYEINNLPNAIEKLTQQTTLRNVLASWNSMSACRAETPSTPSCGRSSTRPPTMGRQGEPCGAAGHQPAAGHQGGDGKADACRAQPPRQIIEAEEPRRLPFWKRKAAKGPTSTRPRASVRRPSCRRKARPRRV